MALQLEGERRTGPLTRVLELTQGVQRFRFIGVPERPVPSLLRGFSAPVIVAILTFFKPIAEGHVVSPVFDRGIIRVLRLSIPLGVATFATAIYYSVDTLVLGLLNNRSTHALTTRAVRKSMGHSWSSRLSCSRPHTTNARGAQAATTTPHRSRAQTQGRLPSAWSG